MKGLLIKEFYGIISYCKITLILALFCVISFFTKDNAEYFVFYPFMLISMIPVTLASLDERYNWENYSMGLPVSKKDLVSVKFLVGAILNIITLLFVGTGYLIAHINDATFTWATYFGLIIFVLGLSFAGPAGTLPFMFKYGVEKGRSISLFTIMICYLPGLILLQEDVQALISNQLVVFSIVGLGSILLYLLAWKWSIKIYQKREF